MTETRKDFLSPAEVCAEYPVFGSPGALAERRWRGEGPDYVKTTPKRGGRVWYRRAAIERWIDERTVKAAPLCLEATA